HGFFLDEMWSAELASGRGSAHLHLPDNTLLSPPPELYSLTDAPPWWRVWTTVDVPHPPLYFIALRLWMSLAGQTDAALRALSVVLSLLTVALLFDTARLLSGRGVALWASVLFALAQPQIDYGRQALYYPLLLLAGMAAANAVARIEKRGASRPRFAALFLATLTALLTHYFCIGAIAALTG